VAEFAGKVNRGDIPRNYQLKRPLNGFYKSSKPVICSDLKFLSALIGHKGKLLLSNPNTTKKEKQEI
jgi:hypothetical protein